MNRRLSNTKTILWALVGVLAVLTLARFMRGLGATTALTDVAPWGFWIAFDVMSGVALAAGGFVVAATVYIFGREEYHRFVRPAILTALLGYVAVAVGLLYDLGLPWHIWHPMIYPQHHSVLFEVAMCVMLYLTVLSLEFAPVVLEHPWFDRPLFRTVHSLDQEADHPAGHRGHRALHAAPVVAGLAVPDHALPAAPAVVQPDHLGPVLRLGHRPGADDGHRRVVLLRVALQAQAAPGPAGRPGPGGLHRALHLRRRCGWATWPTAACCPR